jgi:hypothetical protein
MRSAAATVRAATPGTATAGFVRNRRRRTSSPSVFTAARGANTIATPPAAVLIAAGRVDSTDIPAPAVTTVTVIATSNTSREAREGKQAYDTNSPHS